VRLLSLINSYQFIFCRYNIMQKGGKKKTAWMQHVTKTMAQMPNVALKDVLKAASKTYKKGKSLTGKALMVTKRHRRRRGRKARRKTRRKTRRRVRRRRRRRGGSGCSAKLTGGRRRRRR
jgi:hypothetical protein